MPQNYTPHFQALIYLWVSHVTITQFKSILQFAEENASIAMAVFSLAISGWSVLILFTFHSHELQLIVEEV